MIVRLNNLKPSLHFLWIDLVYDLGRSILSVAALAAVVTSYQLVGALSDSIQSIFLEQDTPANNLVMLAAGMINPVDSVLSESQIQTAAGIIRDEFGSEVLLVASPIIYRPIRHDNLAYAVGAAPASELGDLFDWQLSNGNWPTGENQVVISHSFAVSSGKTIGNRLLIFGQEFTISGEFDSEQRPFAQVWMDLKQALEFYGPDRGYQMGIFQLTREVDITSVQKTIEADPRLTGCCAVYIQSQISEEYNHQMDSLRSLSYVLQFLALLVITFGVYNAAMLTLTERNRDIALLRVAGFLPSTVKLLITGRFLLHMTIAFTVGLGIALLIVNQHAAFTTIAGQPIKLIMSARSILLGAALTLIFTILGVIIPLQQFFRFSTADHLRQK